MMITISPAAAEQILASAQQGSFEGLGLRVAAKRAQDGSMQYGMGFDDEHDGDEVLLSEGVRLLVAPHSVTLLDGTAIDYVEMEPGQFHFIFQNPNDTGACPPSACGGCGNSGGCSSAR